MRKIILLILSKSLGRRFKECSLSRSKDRNDGGSGIQSPARSDSWMRSSTSSIASGLTLTTPENG